MEATANINDCTRYQLELTYAGTGLQCGLMESGIRQSCNDLDLQVLEVKQTRNDSDSEAYLVRVTGDSQRLRVLKHSWR